MKGTLPIGTSESGDDRAVSPVVGVALLIAITVILAAVIGFVVLDTSTSTTEAPNARLDITSTSDTAATIAHEGGNEFDHENVVVLTDGTNSSAIITGDTVGETFNTGDQVTASGLASGSTTNITVVWRDPKSDREIQLGAAEVE